MYENAKLPTFCLLMRGGSWNQRERLFFFTNSGPNGFAGADFNASSLNIFNIIYSDLKVHKLVEFYCKYCMWSAYHVVV